METGSSKYVKAKKEHRCDWCNQKIQTGETYRKQAIFNDGSVYTWKNHKYCDELALKLKMFDGDFGEGLSESDFCDFISDEFRDIMFAKNGTVYTSKNPMPVFKERFKTVIEFHNI